MTGYSTGYEEAIRRINENLEDKKEELILERYSLLSLPHSITRLTHLKTLNISRNEIKDISFLAELKQLESLDLRGNQIQSFSFLVEFKQLQFLGLSVNKVEDLSYIFELPELKSLGLVINQIQNLSFLSNLKQLKSLDLSNNQSQDYSFLTELKQLTSLRLSNNQIRDISFLAELKQLQFLDLSENQIQDISYLAELKQLKTLDLSSNQIQDISALAKLKQLIHLDLSRNQIKEISSLQTLRNLKNLILNDNHIEDITTLKGLNNLEVINLSFNHISIIPTDFFLERNFPKLKNVILGSNPIQNIPKEIFYKNENILDDIRVYFKSLKGETRYLYEAKLILIGNGEVGKSSIRTKLLDKEAPLPKKEDRTPGLDIQTYTIQNLETQITILPEPIDFQLHIWDFGGQGKYREVQQLFCSRKSLYLFVTAYDDQPTNDDYVGFEYWLSMANAFGYDKDNQAFSPIIHILNKIDVRNIPINEVERRSIFINIYPNFIKISCETLQNFDSLELAIKEVIPRICGDVFWNKFSENWLRVKNALQDKELGYHINYSQYFEICQKCEVNLDETSLLINTLDRMGYVIYFGNHPNLKDWIILNPLWVKDAIYKVLDSSIIIDAKFYPQYFSIIWQDYTPEEHQKLLELMLAYQLCYEPKENKGNPYFIIR